MSTENAIKMRESAKLQIRFFKKWFEEAIEGLPDEKVTELKGLVDELLFWQESATNWQHQVDYWQSREAVYPPPGA